MDHPAINGKKISEADRSRLLRLEVDLTDADDLVRDGFTYSNQELEVYHVSDPTRRLEVTLDVWILVRAIITGRKLIKGDTVASQN